MDVLAVATELHMLREKEKQYKDIICQLEEEVKKLKENLASEEQKSRFSVDDVLRMEEKLKDLFKYYTGIEYIRFLGIFSFLAGSSVNYEKGRKDIHKLSLQDGLFFTLCRL